MGFPKKYLNDNEEIILDVRPHWSFLVPSTLALVAALALAIWVSQAVDSEWALFPALGLAVVALLFFLVRYAQWLTTDFVLTTDRLIYRKGIISRTGREIPLERVNDVSFNQNLLDERQRALAAKVRETDVRHRPWFKAVSRHWRTTLIPPYESMQNSEACFTVCTPLRDGNGAITSVLGIDINVTGWTRI